MRPIGILGAFGIVVLASVVLVLMFWVLGQPSLVHWWRAEYLLAGFIAMLIGAVLLARHPRKPRPKTAQGIKEAGLALAKGLAVVFGAVLLLLLLHLIPG